MDTIGAGAFSEYCHGVVSLSLTCGCHLARKSGHWPGWCSGTVTAGTAPLPCLHPIVPLGQTEAVSSSVRVHNTAARLVSCKATTTDTQAKPRIDRVVGGPLWPINIILLCRNSICLYCTNIACTNCTMSPFRIHRIDLKILLNIKSQEHSFFGFTQIIKYTYTYTTIITSIKLSLYHSYELKILTQ